MYKNDFAFIYKQKENLLFAISKKYGKIIIKNDYFYNFYQEIKSFFFINFEFNTVDMHQIQNTEKIILKKSYIQIETIISINTISKNIHQFVYILDHCILCKMPTKNIFNIIEYFFNNIKNILTDNEKENSFYELYEYIFIELNLIEKKIYQKKIIAETLIELFPYDSNQIKLLFKN